MKCKWTSRNDKNLKCENECGDDEYCILHKTNRTQQENEELIKYITENKLNEIIGVVFEEDFIAKEIIKYRYNKLIFKDVVFMKSTNFEDFEFKRKVIFQNVEFLGKTSYKRAKFLSSCIFIKCKFNEGVSKQKLFLDTLFIGQNLEINNITNLPRLDGIKFDGHTKIIMREVEYEKEFCQNGKINYRIARNQANRIGDSERIGYYYYKERYYGSKSMKKEDYPSYEHYISSKFFDRISKYVIGYGERPWNVLISTFTTISIFAIIYMFVGVRDINSGEIKLQLQNLNNYKLSEIISMYIDLWYFSMITFSTVGYGDMIVTTSIAKIVVSMEVFFGVTIGATWTSVIIKRMIK